MQHFGLESFSRGQEIRLDPCALPQNISYFFSDKTFTCSLKEDDIYTLCHQDEKVVCLPRRIPVKEFQGVAAKLVVAPNGYRMVLLLLLHAQEELQIPLLLSRDLNDVLLNWRLWCDTYDLPMLLIQDNGAVAYVYEQNPLARLRLCTERTSPKHSPAALLKGCRSWLRLVIKGQPQAL